LRVDAISARPWRQLKLDRSRARIPFSCPETPDTPHDKESAPKYFVPFLDTSYLSLVWLPCDNDPTDTRTTTVTAIMLQRMLANAWLVLACTLSRSVLGLTPLSDESLRNIPIAGADFDIKTGSILAPILIPRVPGTPGSKQVQQHFVDWFATHLPDWTVTYQNSTSKTPATGDKQVPFVNIIITRDPPWTRVGDVGRLALVAHYDSKLDPPGFIGAIDSAAPCAMIMHAARSVDQALTKKWAVMEAEGSHGLEEEKGIQLIFLDGEEAFVVWTDQDSLYGSR
jgi:hypothetical protein